MKGVLNLFILLTLVSLNWSCDKNNPSHEKDKFKDQKENITTIISEDSSKLSQFLNLTFYRPTHVKFKQTIIDNRAHKDVLAVLGPTTIELEAILFFDSLTFDKLTFHDRFSSYLGMNSNKDRFNFSWLDQNIKDELTRSDDINFGDSRPFFRNDFPGKAWFLDNKVLIRI